MHGPHDAPLRWLIESRTTSGESYLVDLGDKICQCRWAATQVNPKLKRGEPVSQFCHHYYEAKRRFTDWAIEKFKEHEILQDTRGNAG